MGQQMSRGEVQDSLDRRTENPQTVRAAQNPKASERQFNTSIGNINVKAADNG
jgi:hypothetical protein